MALPGFGQMVRLRDHLTVEKGADVRLGEMATVTGAGASAERLANVVVVSGVQGPVKVKAEAILMAVIAQQGAASTTNLEMSGAAVCDIQSPAAKPLAAARPEGTEKKIEAAVAPAADRKTPAPAPAAAPAADGSSLASVLTARIQKELDVPSENVSVSFDVLNPALDRSAGAGRVWLVRPLTRTFLGTVPFEAQLVEGDKVVQRLSISAHVEKKTHITVATRAIARGDVVTAADVREEDAMLDRELPNVFAAASAVVGLEAKVPVGAGQHLDQRDFKPSELAAKDEEITVVFVTGSLKVEARGKALQGGALHSQIEVKNIKNNATYLATLVGKRLAVVGDLAAYDALTKPQETVR
jgi:flagella basal body P-ring formation protein FlgA